ncbi:MAG: class I SAM-dependent methyltransferase [Acidobacteria bacterium]|nr:class I SAM-dependent methyltransferase [Acidobacteriota bacterium]
MDYTNPELNRWSVDTYHIRASIVRELKAALPHMHGSLLDVGCGRSPYKPLLTNHRSRVTRYTGLDIPSPQYATQPDVSWDGGRIPLDDGLFDTAVATEVLEHSPDPQSLLNEICRVLRPGGFFFMTVPYLWPLHDIPYDHFRYTPFSLERMLTNARFSRTELRATGGWDASLATMLGLWVRRRPVGPRWEGILARLAFPVYKMLINRDRPPQTFDKSVMITGLAASAWK